MDLTNKDVAGTFRGSDGSCCSPTCVTIDVSPSCGGGICWVQKLYGCPCYCGYACKCGNGCWYHGSNNGMQFFTKDQLVMDCGTCCTRVLPFRTFNRTGGAPATKEMER